MPGRPKNERPGARPGRWVGRGHDPQEGRRPSGALVAGERLVAGEGEGSGVAWAGATREGGSRIIRAPPGLQVTRPRLEPQWRARAAPAPAINNSTHSHRAQIFGGGQVGEQSLGKRACDKNASQLGSMSILEIRARARQEGGKRLELGRTICRTVTRKAATFLTLTRCPQTLGPSNTSQLALALSKN